MSQRGLYGMTAIPTASIRPGTAPRPSIQRQLSAPMPLSPKLTMYAARIPDTIMSWLNDTSPPRMRFGESSARYIGETNDAVPTERPSTNRAAISWSGLWEKAHPSAASV